MRPMTIALLTTALLTVTSPAAVRAADDALARRLLNSQGCKACHPFEGGGATLGPKLDGVGSRLSAAQLREKLVNSGHRHAGGRIADFSHLSQEQIEALVTFLSQRL